MGLRFACAAALALAATACASAPAHASAFLPAFDPLQSNRPHLAWRGEEIRLVHCAAGLNPDSGAPGDGSAQYDADWAVMAWSGTGVPASVAGGSVKFVIDNKQGSPHFGQQCVRANFRSAGAGLAVVQLDIRNQSTGASLVSRQFLAGWLSLKQVALDDGFGGTTVFDGPGWGSYNWLRARVTATLPLSGFGELVQPAGPFPSVIHLPAEAPGSPAAGQGDPSTWYDDLALRLATTTSSETVYRTQPWLMWDVHDDQGTAAGHVDGDAALSPASPYNGSCDPIGVDFLPVLDMAVDAVDNCTGGPAEEGPFSRIWPTFTSGLAIGPFDPLRAAETFLGDGRITAGDVVLPSAPIELVIAPNSGAVGDVSGTGTLEALDKEDVYVRRAEAGHDAPHNMYAPFYRAYIPATRAELAGHGLSSGSDAQWSPSYPNYVTCDPSGGTAQASEDCSYAYWEIEDVLESVVGQDTGCLYRYRSGAPEFRPTPMGDQAVVVYSDEHGEAMVKYVPGWDFYYDSLAANFPGVLNANGGCDLQDVSPLGTAEVTATARYPGQSVLDIDKVSNVVTESTYNNFTKELACAPKAASGPDRLLYICTALSIDIDGTAMAQSRACFSATGADSMAAYPAGTPFTLEGVGRLCVQTDWNGEAKVELSARCSTPAGSVTADFADERIVRTAAVDFSYCPAPPPPPVTTTTPTTTSAPPVTTTTTPKPAHHAGHDDDDDAGAHHDDHVAGNHDDHEDHAGSGPRARSHQDGDAQHEARPRRRGAASTEPSAARRSRSGS